MTICRGPEMTRPAEAGACRQKRARPGLGGMALAGCKTSQQLVQAEAFLQLRAVQLPVVMLLQQRHELVLPDTTESRGGSAPHSS